MGHIWVRVRICSLDGSRCVEAEGLVDTWATLSVVPRKLAERLGLKPHRVDRVQTGASVVEVEGRRTVTEVWVSDVIDKVLVGATTLEMLGLRVDPVTGRLVEAPLLLY